MSTKTLRALLIGFVTVAALASAAEAQTYTTTRLIHEHDMANAQSRIAWGYKTLPEATLKLAMSLHDFTNTNLLEMFAITLEVSGELSNAPGAIQKARLLIEQLELSAERKARLEIVKDAYRGIGANAQIGGKDLILLELSLQYKEMSFRPGLIKIVE